MAMAKPKYQVGSLVKIVATDLHKTFMNEPYLGNVGRVGKVSEVLTHNADSGYIHYRLFEIPGLWSESYFTPAKSYFEEE